MKSPSSIQVDETALFRSWLLPLFVCYFVKTCTMYVPSLQNRQLRLAARMCVSSPGRTLCLLCAAKVFYSLTNKFNRGEEERFLAIPSLFPPKKRPDLSFVACFLFFLLLTNCPLPRARSVGVLCTYTQRRKQDLRVHARKWNKSGPTAV